MLNIRRDDLTAGYNYGISTVHQGVRLFRSVTDDLMGQVLGLKIDERVDLNDLNYTFMKRFMALNINDHDVTMSILGQDAHLFGNPNVVTGQAQRPSYTNGMNYLNDFVSRIEGDEKIGENSTVIKEYPKTHDPYASVKNLYPDDIENKGTGNFRDTDKWKVGSNYNSILYKTKKLFTEKKINTLISRFATGADDGASPVEGAHDAVTKYGMSHGRNLLHYKAEKAKGVGNYDVNGYNNPYCRVWTHHHQYDRLSKLIRPFVIQDENSYNGETVKLSKFHHWTTFGQGWKDEDSSKNWEKSVLDDNGFVKITPKFGGGGKNNIHTKDCMFSIENLAWRGYDPYSFEKALSWEQRGPLGGRIMWFPPYGLTFNETTQTNWSSNTFIGRGEDVYTYVNTVRSGTLSFIMLTDHPSVIDYANWYDNPDNATVGVLEDTDILRFFAGCDSCEDSESSILSKVKPTPLTDEMKYASTTMDAEIISEFKPEIVPEEDVKDSVKTVEFYVFYPNNYSGCYDMPNATSPVHAIAYLLGGNGCNKEWKQGDDVPVDKPLTFANFDVAGNGYEMSDSGISYTGQIGEKDYIIGSELRWIKPGMTSKDLSERVKDISNKNYIKSSRQWLYRIDGEYENPDSIEKAYSNTYDQVLTVKDNYEDKSSYKLNLSSDAVIGTELVSESDSDKIYSLAEVAFAIATGTSKYINEETSGPEYEGIFYYLENKINQDKVNKLIDLLKYNKLTKVDVVGFSNSHGSNTDKSINDIRNDKLALSRANTVINWLKECNVGDDNTIFTPSSKPSQAVDANNPSNSSTDKTNASSLKAKIYRSAKVTMTFELETTEKLSDTNLKSEAEPDKAAYQKYVGFTPAGIDEKTKKNRYKDNEGNYWYDDDGTLKRSRIVSLDSSELTERYAFEDGTESGKNKYGRKLLLLSNQRKGAVNETNSLRYDQEYHFFKRLEKDNPIVFDKLTEKLKYFDPAFHSMTPEGFTERLTFLQQCTRQGNTISSSDGVNGKTATNLAFGRPPFCVLRIGDFYYQTIVIDSINIDYSVSSGLQWDLNPEGAGVQPMLAQVNISFKFIGGGDLGGPIRRLQNAMTFNYYANSRLHDNRADKVAYKGDNYSIEMGSLDYDVNTDASSAYLTQMSK